MPPFAHGATSVKLRLQHNLQSRLFRPLTPVYWQPDNALWSLLRSWLRPHRGISQEKLPDYLGFFQFVHNARRRGKALLSTLIAALVT
jgi:transposase-like protein